MIKCGENPLLAKVQAGKDALKAKMAAIKVPGVDVSAALAEIKAAKVALKKDLLASVPEIPKLPDFRKELDGIINGATARLPGWEKKLKEFENQWGGAVEDVQQLVQVIADPLKLINGIDLCSQPDVEGEPGPDGKLQKKEKPLPAQDSTEPPKETPKTPAPIEATAIKIEEPVGTSDIDALTAARALDAHDDLMRQAYGSLHSEQDRTFQFFGLYKLAPTLAERGVSKSFKDRFPGAHVAEYYIVEGAAVPAAYNTYILGQSWQSALTSIRSTAKKLEQMIGDYLASPQWTTDFAGGKWTAEAEERLSKFWYENVGFGILEKNPNYGSKLKDEFVTKEAKQFLPPVFDLKPYDYRASSIPTIRDLNDIINGTETTVVKDFNNFYSEIVLKLFETGYASDGGETNSALAYVTAHASGKKLSEVLETMPTSSDFIPKALGGNLTSYEQIFIADYGETQSARGELNTFSASSFKPHYMYKGANSIYVNSHAEHVQLANLGYTHNQT